MVLTSSTLCMDSNEWSQIHHHKLQPSDLMVSLPLLLPSTTTTTTTTTTPTTSSSSSSTKAAATMDQLVTGTVKPQPDPTLKCPRCDSNNTKFCYYNNYSLSQPRHFCKACKRYWTKGGTLRNVPVGGGCRKNKRQVKRSSTSSSSTSTHHLGLDPINATTTQSMILTSSSTMQNPNLFMNNQDFMHLNSSLMTSLKSAISGLGFPHDKEECNFMQDHQLQGGFTHMTTHETGSIFPTSLPNMGQHVGGDHHGLNGSVIMASEPHWIRQIHQHNLFVPLDDELVGPKSAGNIDDHHNGNSMRNMDMKIEDHDHGVGRINMGGQNIHEWHIPNLNVFEANNITSDQAAAGLFWNTSNIGPWTDVNNYGSSSVASML